MVETHVGHTRGIRQRVWTLYLTRSAYVDHYETKTVTVITEGDVMPGDEISLKSDEANWVPWKHDLWKVQTAAWHATDEVTCVLRRVK